MNRGRRPTETVLIVEDDEGMRESCADSLMEAGYPVLTASAPGEAQEHLARAVVDLVLTDLRMAGGGGREVVRLVRQLAPGVPVVIMTAFPTVQSAVDALRDGVVDYLVKPFNYDQLLRSVEGALAGGRAQDRAELLRRVPPTEGRAPAILGTSVAIRTLLAEVARVALVQAAVLVTGETGSGKELAARAVHDLSARARGPFVAVNCAAIPEALFEAEVFGHERGAFTGAVAARAGLLEEAHGGTLFLDEVGDLPANAQAKLLRAIEEGGARRVGSSHVRPVDVRAVSATNRDLRAEVRAGRFREDMYYRLAALDVRVPPLRERPEDIPLLAVHFLAKAGGGERGLVGFAEDAMEALQSAPWQGNVRELQNFVQRLVAHSAGPLVTVRDVEASGLGPSSRQGAGPLHAAVGVFERDYLASMLERHAGNVSQTAKALGVHRTTLQRLMGKFGLGRDL